jgi:hypothetical protein
MIKERMPEEDNWPLLVNDDDGLLKILFELLSSRVKANPYGSDSGIAGEINQLPVGLRAMAATHHLDISMTLDSVCWHYRNFGETKFVDLTEEGLRELGLEELADVFHEAGLVMMPLNTPKLTDWNAAIEENGLEARVEEIDRRGWDVYGEAAKPSNGTIYDAWLRYARQHPERVFV